MDQAAEWYPADKLEPWVDNYMDHPQRQIDIIKDSIRRNGWGEPIVALEGTCRLISGHGRLAAYLQLKDEAEEYAALFAVEPGEAKMLSQGLVPVRFRALPLDRAAELAIAANEAARMGKRDDTRLAAVVARLAADRSSGEITARAMGMRGTALAKILRLARIGEGPTPPAPPIQTEAIAHSKLGEVYELGSHRLVCGDAGDPEVWASLMQGSKLQMVWTDPPYGVAVIDGNRKDDRKQRLARGGRTIMNDALKSAELTEFLRLTLGLALEHTKSGGAWYVASPPGPPFLSFGQVLTDFGVWRQTLTWDKAAFVLGFSDYQCQHEAVIYGWKPGAAHYFCDDRSQTSVQVVKRPAPNKDHPTMKPPALVRSHIRNSSKRGWIVGDPFGGSGTTLIASAIEGRVCRTIELDPIYCDVIRRRWHAYAVSVDIDPGPGALSG